LSSTSVNSLYWTMDQYSTIILFSFICLVNSGLVKRDTLTDLEDIGNSIGNSFKDMVGLETNNNIIDDIKNIDEEKYCVADSQCFEHIQFCNMEEKKLYGVCSFHTWFWIGLAGIISFIFCSCLTLSSVASADAAEKRLSMSHLISMQQWTPVQTM